MNTAKRGLPELSWIVTRPFLMGGEPVASGANITINDRELIGSLLSSRRIVPADEATAAFVAAPVNTWREGAISTRYDCK